MEIKEASPSTAGKKYPVWIKITTALIILIIIFYGAIISFISDMQWYASEGYSGVFNRLVAWKAAGFGIDFLIFAIPAGISLFFISKLRTKMPQIIKDGVIEHPSANPANIGIPVLITAVSAVIVGIIGTDISSCGLYMTAFNACGFGTADPVFGKDPSFYIFLLPMMNHMAGILAASVFISALTAAGFYLFSRGPAGIPQNMNLPEPLKKHVLSLISALFIISAAFFLLSCYDLLSNSDGLMSGAFFTDIYAKIPALRIMAGAMLFSAFFIFRDLKTGNWKHITIACSLCLIVFLFSMVIYPGIIQKFFVSPSELTKEKPFIQRNMEATKKAFGLEKFTEYEHPGSDRISAEGIKNNSLTVKNIRLWDDKPLLEAYSELQEIRTYYKFSDIDFDRYEINGEYRQVMVSPRELDASRIPDRKWINETFTYTHGYGACIGPVNSATSDGLPEFFIKDIPPTSDKGLKIENPAIYYGEISDGYRIVNSNEKEFDYPSGDDNVYCSYSGKGGVNIGGLLNRLIYSSYFGDIKILLSSEIKPESRILFNRKVTDIASRITPFVRYDRDPYLVSSEGRLKWIIDGYTISSSYPYSEYFYGINYIRNSVKAVADAYDGSIDFYISDPEDPMLTTYDRMLGKIFKPISDMPADLRKHLRYPETLLKVQAHAYARYHMKDVQVFYNQEDLWKISSSGASKNGSSIWYDFPWLPEGIYSGENELSPYYTILKLPDTGSDKEEFVLMMPFSPARKSNLISLMAARCDGEHYGEVAVYSFPKDKLIYGPQQIDSRIDQDPEISKQLTLWTQGGSNAVRGKLMVIPIEDSLIYVEPLFLAASSGKIPQLKKIFVVCGDRVAMEDTLDKAVEAVFGSSSEKAKTIETAQASETRANKEAGVSADPVNDVASSLEKAKKAMRDGDWAAYGKEMENLEKAVKRLKDSAQEK